MRSVRSCISRLCKIWLSRGLDAGQVQWLVSTAYSGGISGIQIVFALNRNINTETDFHRDVKLWCVNRLPVERPL